MLGVMAKGNDTDCFIDIHRDPYRYCGYLVPLFGCVLILFMVLGSTDGFASPGPEDVIATMSHNTIDAIRNHRSELVHEPGLFYELVETTSVPYFDVDAISRLVLGRYWRTATKEEQTRFTLAFKHLVINSYANALLHSNIESISVIPVPDRKLNAARVRIDSIVTTQTGKTITISYRLRRAYREWKIYDLTIEGVSLVLNYKHSFAEQIRQNGLDGLINKIEEKNARFSQ